MIRFKSLFQGLAYSFVLLVIAAIIFKTTPNSLAKQFDVDYAYLWNLVSLAVLVLGIVINGPLLLQQIKKIKFNFTSLGLLAALVLFIGIFSAQNIRLQHRVLSDESSWESMAIQMYDNGDGAVCNQGIFQDDKLNCHDKVNNFKGKALSLAYVTAFQFFPASRDTALYVNTIFFLLAIPLLYFAVLLRWNKPWLALSSATFLATMPKLMFQSRSASTEVMHVFLFVLLLVLIQLLRKEGDKLKHWLIIIPIMGLFAQTRQETLFSFVAFTFYYLPFFQKKSLHLPIWVISLLLACFPMIAVICGYKGYDFQGGEYEAHSMYNLYVNFWENIKILLNVEDGYKGLLKYPYLTTSTILTYLGIALTALQALRGKYWKEALFGLLFFVQPIVIMINVSGNFNIDINQRYVLVILPMFAICAALGVHWTAETWLKKPAYASMAISAIMVCLILSHTSSFQANIHYKGNKLLEEELFLNTKLKEFPSNSIYIYARPWQMIASRFNAFSESSFLNWTEEEHQKWRDYSKGNIYLVRGQDGYGTVNRKSRVVGFKTTDKIKSLLNKYETEEVFSQTKLFGYPLSITRIDKPKGSDPYSQKLSLYYPKNTQTNSIQAQLKIGFSDSVRIQWTHPIQLDTVVSKELNLTLKDLSKGAQHFSLTVHLPNGKTKQWTKNFFVETDGATRLTQISPKSSILGWGSLKTNRSIENNTLSTNQIKYPYGLGAHAPATISYSLHGKFTQLNAKFGLDDESMCGDGATFIVKGDGKILFTSKVLYAQQLDSLRLNISGVNHLELITEEGENNMCDHTDWLMPWVI